MRDIDYYKEVFALQSDINVAVSCVDSELIANESEVSDAVDDSHSSEGTGGCGDGGGDPNDTSGVAGGDLAGGSGTEWCFVDPRGIAQFCWRNNVS